MSNRSFGFALALPVLLGGCSLGTVVDVATAPVRGVAQVADWATTSGDERDRARGREIREREERLGALQRDYEDKARDCLNGRDRACRQAVLIRQEMDAIIPTIPLEPQED